MDFIIDYRDYRVVCCSSLLSSNHVISFFLCGQRTIEVWEAFVLSKIKASGRHRQGERKENSDLNGLLLGLAAEPSPHSLQQGCSEPLC